MTETVVETDVLLRVDDLKVHFPIKRGIIFDKTIGYVYAVDGVSLAIRRGETYGLVAASRAVARPRSAGRSCGWSSRPAASSTSTAPTFRASRARNCARAAAGCR